MMECGFKIAYTHLGFATAATVPLGSRVTQDAYFSLLTHTKQLLLVTFCDTLAGIEVSFWVDGTGRTDERTDRRMDRQTWRWK